MGDRPLGLDHDILPASERYELAVAAAEGDLDARNRLVEHSLRLIWKLAGGSTLPAEQRLDLYDVGVLAALDAVASFPDNDNGSKPTSYLAAAARNAMLDHAYPRRRWKDEDVPDFVGLEAAGELSSEDVDEEDPDLRRQRRIIGLCFNRAGLTHEEKMAIAWAHGLVYDGAMSFRELAVQLGCSKTTAKRRYDEAIGKLRAAGVALEDEQGAEIRRIC